MSNSVYLIDGSSYIYRAYHAIAPLSNSNGLPTHAVLGFVNMFHRLVKEKSPDHIAIAFDSRGPVFRHEMYPDYKANRPPMPEDLAVQIPYIKRFVRGSGAAQLELQGVEADDLIASATVALVRQGVDVVIVSGDKDLLQLVSEGVTLWDPMRDKVMDAAEVEKKYGVGPGSLLEFFALVGDSADNVPGVPGVGLKTARKLIEEYGSLDGLYGAVDTMKKSKMKEKLIANKEQAYLSKDLIRLKEDVPVPAVLSEYIYSGGDMEVLKDLYRELEFHSLLKGIEGEKKFSLDGISLVQNKKELNRLATVLKDASRIVLDTETTSIVARKAELVGISLCTGFDDGWYLPVGHRSLDGKLLPDQLLKEDVAAFLRALLERSELELIGHNLKYDITVLKQQLGLDVRCRLRDTLIAAHLLIRGEGSLKLDDLCRQEGYELMSFEQAVEGDKAPDAFSRVGVERAAQYSCEDVFATLLLWEKYEPELLESDLFSLFSEVEMKILAILVEMETEGICIDQAVLKTLEEEFQAILLELSESIKESAGHEFNINSPKQLGQVLFEELGLPHGRKTKTGYSTDVKVLEKLAPRHELPAMVLRFRTVTKLLSTYVEKLSELCDKETGRVYTTFHQAVTATGRLSSSEPNLQNIPIRTEEGARIRSAFVAGRDKTFLSADYSQIDLRVLAHYSQDPALVEAFRDGQDIHSRTAAEIFGVSPMMVTGEMRRVAKSINFGIVYGMSAFGLSSQLNIGRKEAQRFIDRYFNLYSGVKEYMESVVLQARKNGFVSTLLKRRRYFPEINAKNKNRREFAERMAINTPIQGSAADIIKLAMIKCQDVIKQKGLAAKMLLQIHDELVFELPESEVDTGKTLFKTAMEEALEIDVPLAVNFSVGKSLAK